MRTFLSGILLLLLATAAQAALPTGLAESLRPVDGIVIKSNNGECLIDLGTLNGVREGDLIAVLDAGEDLKHPVTGASLGHIDRARTLLRIERIKPDFSWARQLDPKVVIQPTDPVRRLAEVPSVFIDQRGDGHPFFNELQQALPHLAWRPWGETSLGGPGLVFTLNNQTLTVHDDNGTLVDSWPAEPALKPPTMEQPMPAVATAAAAPAVAQQLQVIGPIFDGKPNGVAIADFDGDSVLEIAVSFDEGIEIGRFNGKQWVAVAKFALEGAVKALTLDAVDLDGNGQAELIVTATRNNLLASQVWGYDGSAYRLKAENIPWLLRVMELPGEGRVALAQEFDARNHLEYVGKPFRVTWQDGDLRAAAQVETFTAPTLHGSQPFSAQQEALWGWLTDNDKLAVFDSAGKEQWQGREPFGGGEAFIQRKPTRPREEERRLFIRSRLSRDGDLLIVPQNQGTRTLKNWRMAESSRLVALRWNNLRLEEAWSTPLRDGYLADFAAADLNGDGRIEYILAGTLSAGDAGIGAQSTLFLWENR